MERSDSIARPAFAPEAIEKLRVTLPDDHLHVPDPARRAAAVLIPLFVEDGALRVVLTLRSDHMPSHAGQVSFPGGGWKQSDPDLLATALRESHEEIGLLPDHVDVLGALADSPTAGSSFVIRPFVGSIPPDYPFEIDPGEVVRVLTAPLELFADPGRRRTETFERGGVSYPVYYFDDVDDTTVWGATARILVSLCEHMADRGQPPVRIPPAQ